MCLSMSNEMKWFCACHRRLGRKISIERATPIHNHLIFKYRRTSVNSTAATMLRAKNPIVHFDSMPKPIDAPMAAHHRGSADFSRRTTKYAVITQARQSNATYCIS